MDHHNEEVVLNDTCMFSVALCSAQLVCVGINPCALSASRHCVAKEASERREKSCCPETALSVAQENNAAD